MAKVQHAVESKPRLAAAWVKLSTNFDLPATFARLLEQVRDAATGVVSGFVYTVVQALIALFVLFFLIRDHGRAIIAIARPLPAVRVGNRRPAQPLADTIYATIFGTVVVALIQGSLGGLIFWFLGLPTPALWGLAMGLLAIVPYLAAFVIWAPAAAILALHGEWWKAGALVLWGQRGDRYDRQSGISRARRKTPATAHRRGIYWCRWRHHGLWSHGPGAWPSDHQPHLVSGRTVAPSHSQ